MKNNHFSMHDFNIDEVMELLENNHGDGIPAWTSNQKMKAMELLKWYSFMYFKTEKLIKDLDQEF